MRTLKQITLAVLALAAFIAVAQNTGVVSFRFLVWELSMSRIVLLPAAVLVGFVMGFVAAKLPRR